MELLNSISEGTDMNCLFISSEMRYYDFFTDLFTACCVPKMLVFLMIDAEPFTIFTSTASEFASFQIGVYFYTLLYLFYFHDYFPFFDYFIHTA